MTIFSVISGSTVQSILEEDLAATIDLVQDVYLSHKAGATVNPDSYFLRFPTQPRDRIIALPAALLGQSRRLAGIKWISSFPENIDRGIPRASAVLILNDIDTGIPYACIEASAISAVRTAASAVLGARWLGSQRKSGGTIGFVGAGIIARTILEMFAADGWEFDELSVYDLNEDYARALVSFAQEGRAWRKTRAVADLSDALEADIVVLATTSSVPYISPPNSFRPSQVILNISLRDIDPALVLESWNVVDDIDHCLKAETSPHLAERVSGNRRFIAGTLADLINGNITIDDQKPLIFSPFGMGILDLALGQHVYETATIRSLVQTLPDFYAHTSRW
jgi:2,3-diaminopropionate biosynthesis protein SbnB